ncbi:hypothetical protein B484DRAFT_389596, partial [Ochromonadaceae sp. CCMP2298]
GVGKSTCLRLIVNRLLGEQRLDRQGQSQGQGQGQGLGQGQGQEQGQGGRDGVGGAGAGAGSSAFAGAGVCVLDLDMGQPELSLPGCLSLHLVSQPLLSPPHLHMQTPLRSVFLGDLSCKLDPAGVLSGAQQLITMHAQIQQAAARAERLRGRQAAQKFVAANAYNALLLDDSDSDSDEKGRGGQGGRDGGGGGGGALSPLPLVVNLDGYVKGLGLQVLEGILGMLDPTHVLLVHAERDRDLLPADIKGMLGMVEVQAGVGDVGGNSNSNSISSSSSKNNNSNGNSNSKSSVNRGREEAAPAPESGENGAAGAGAGMGAGADAARCAVLSLLPGRAAA